MYFRNNILHLFVVPSLIACLFTQQRSVSRTRIERLIQQAWPVFCAQYYLDDQALPQVLENSIAAMAQVGLLEIENNRVQRPSESSLQTVLLFRLATLVRPTIEQGYLAAALLAEFRNGIELDEYTDRFRSAAHRFAMTEARDPNEVYNKASFQTVIDSLVAIGAVNEHDGKLRANTTLHTLGSEIRQVLPDVTRHEMLAAARLAARGDTHEQNKNTMD